LFTFVELEAICELDGPASSFVDAIVTAIWQHVDAE
jgi:hypothetical protein